MMPVEDVSGGKSKVQCCKEQYCIGIWNVRSMNQGKLKVVSQEMARVNIDILEITEIKWTEMGELNLDDHYIYYCGQESLRRNGYHSNGRKQRGTNSLLTRGKEESEKAGLKLSIKKLKSWHLVPSHHG